MKDLPTWFVSRIFHLFVIFSPFLQSTAYYAPYLKYNMMIISSLLRIFLKFSNADVLELQMTKEYSFKSSNYLFSYIQIWRPSKKPLNNIRTRIQTQYLTIQVFLYLPVIRNPFTHSLMRGLAPLPVTCHVTHFAKLRTGIHLN